MLGRLLLPTLMAFALFAGCASNDDPAPAAPSPAASPAPAPAPASPSPQAEPAPAPAPSPAAAPSPAPAPEPALPATPIEVETGILAAAFGQPLLEVPVGSTISWRNLDAQTHSVVSDDGLFASSGPLAPGMEFRRTFLAAGEFPYHCRYHPDMTGLIVVA